MCKGQPCHTTSNPILDQSNNITIEQTCSTGWSVWINVNQLKNEEFTKFEYMPSFEDLKSVKYNDIKGLKSEVTFQELQQYKIEQILLTRNYVTEIWNM